MKDKKFLVLNVFNGRRWVMRGESRRDIERQLGQRSIDMLIQPYIPIIKEKSLPGPL